jgi:crotonobetainyl-CoA:carnitine CoA-transferase CaiB-like acyl-CoA transferase
MGIASETECGVGIVETFAAADGHFVLQVVREHHFAILAEAVGAPEWLSDERLSTRAGWQEHLGDVLRPGIETWAAAYSVSDAVARLSAAGLAAGVSQTSAQVVADPHLKVRNMLVELPRPDGLGSPVIVPGNPIKMSRVAEGPETRVPWLGEHTDEVLKTELNLTEVEIDGLRERGVIG